MRPRYRGTCKGHTVAGLLRLRKRGPLDGEVELLVLDQVDPYAKKPDDYQQHKRHKYREFDRSRAVLFVPEPSHRPDAALTMT